MTGNQFDRERKFICNLERGMELWRVINAGGTPYSCVTDDTGVEIYSCPREEEAKMLTSAGLKMPEKSLRHNTNNPDIYKIAVSPATKTQRLVGLLTDNCITLKRVYITCETEYLNDFVEKSKIIFGILTTPGACGEETDSERRI